MLAGGSLGTDENARAEDATGHARVRMIRKPACMIIMYTGKQALSSGNKIPLSVVFESLGICTLLRRA